VDEHDLSLRRRIFDSFAATGTAGDHGDVRSLAEQHVVALDAEGKVWMAHPFAAHHEGTRVDSGGRTWWGNCAWDGFGIVAALGLEDATITDHEIALEIRDGAVRGDAVFHVRVPARRWWDDIGDT
jgi:Alkylmercury lyase